MWRHYVQYRVKYVSVYSTQVWSTSEALPSAIDVSCTVHESGALVEALPSGRSVPCSVHLPKSVRKCQ